ncbi:MAG: PAS domain S-box protein [Gemmatimonadaceae bacterium]
MPVSLSVTTVERIAGMNRQRLVVLGAFLGVCVALQQTTAGFPPAVTVIVGAWIVLALLIFPALRTARSQEYLVRLQTLTYAADIGLLTATYSFVGGGWWMGGTFYAFTIVFASMSAPRSHTLALGVYASTLFSALLLAQAADVLPYQAFLGSPSIAGNYAFAMATAGVTAVTLILLALLPHTFITMVQRSEKRHDLLLDAAHEGVWTVDRDGIVDYANPRIAELVGQRVEDLLGRSLFDFACGTSPNQLLAGFERCKQGIREVRECDLRCTPPHELCALVSFSPVAQGDGEFRGAIVMVSDITERKRAEKAVQQSEVSSRSFVEHAPYGIYRSTMAGEFLAVNGALVRMLGHGSEAELMAVTITSFYRDSRDRDALMERLMRESDIGPAELDWTRKDGTGITVRLGGRPVYDVQGAFLYWEGFVEDVTQLRTAERALRESEEQLRQSQKMEAIGRLAGGVAHDFNNLLTVIRTSTDFLLDDLTAADARRGDVEEIGKAADRAAALTRQLLAFSRKQLLKPRLLGLNGIIVEVEKMLRRLTAANVNLVTVLAPELGVVRADPGQVEQVLLNLTVNASDAMPQGGTLTIETSNVELDRKYAESHPEVEPGQYVMIVLSDTGSGMDRQTQSRIFEPFFTTKDLNKGTGLGLSTVYGIVKQSGGHISVYSKLGHGTTFKVYLPRVYEMIEAPAPQAATPQRGCETVLLVEDEEGVRAVVGKILRKDGYCVLEARHGVDALLASDRYNGTIHLLLSDLVMPEMGGRELAERLEVLRPGLQVLLMSGYTDDAIARRKLSNRETAFIQKPFTSLSLLQSVRAVLDRKGGLTLYPTLQPAQEDGNGGGPERLREQESLTELAGQRA